MWCCQCNQLMNEVIRCDYDNEIKKYYRCPICYYESRAYPYKIEVESKTSIDESVKVGKSKKIVKPKKNKKLNARIRGHKSKCMKHM